MPRDGVELYSPSVDVVGAFAKDCNTLRDVSRLIYDDWEEPDPDGRLPRKLVVLETFRDAVCTAEAKRNFAQALAYLRDAGFESAMRVTTPLLDDFASLAQRHRCLVNAELKKGHAKRFADHGPLYRPETAALLRASYDAVVDPGSMEALREELEAALGDTFAFFVAPAAATVPPLLAEGTTGDPSASLPFAHAGLPSVTLPVGRDHATNLPVCLQFVGRAGADEALLQFAARLEERAFPALSS